MGTRRGTRWYAVVVAMLSALVAGAFGVTSNVAASLVPTGWAREHAVLVWAVTVVLGVILVYLAYVMPKTETPTAETRSAPPSDPMTLIAPGSTFHVGRAPSPVLPGQIVVGELPSAPPAFVDRAVQDELKRVLHDGRVAVVCALTGGRGVGKTQVAAAYARMRAATGYPLVAWVSAASRDTLISGLADVARAVGVADENGDSQVSATNLRHALELRTTPGVLVIDNATDADFLRQYLPAFGSVELILTSTDRSFEAFGTALHVGSFTPSEARNYLAERTGHPIDADADGVREALGDLPLALAQAVSVMRLQNLSYGDYLSRLTHYPVEAVLTRREGDPYPLGAAQAILLSLDAVEDADASGWVKALLDAIALLSADGVSRELLYSVAGNLFDEQATDDDNAHAAFDTALEHLVTLSLLTWREAGESVVTHRLVGRVIRDRMLGRGEFSMRFLSVSNALVPHLATFTEAWAQRHQLANTVLQCVALWELAVTSSLTGDPELFHAAHFLVNWSIVHLTHAQDLSRAVVLGSQVLSTCELLFPDSRRTLTARNSLASALESAGGISEAITHFERNVEESDRVLGRDHVLALRARSNVANAYRSAHRIPDAIRLGEAVVADSERVLGGDDHRTLTARNNLAGTYEVADRIDDAIRLHERTLADRGRVLGTEHPDTLTSRHNLAGAYEEAGRHDESIALHVQSLADHKRVLGPDHPHTLVVQNCLASAYQSSGRLPESIRLNEQTLAESERLLGFDHPDTLASRNNLASVYYLADRLPEALALAVENLGYVERVFGRDHPSTLVTRNNLAMLYTKGGRTAEAIALLEKNLAETERLFGAGHEQTRRARADLAARYHAAAQQTERDSTEPGNGQS